MKLLLFLLVASTACFAQDIPRGTSAIVLTTSLADSVLFDKTIRLLNSQEYVIDRSDPKYGTIATQTKAGKGLMSGRVLVNLQNGVATFKSQWSAQTMGYSFTNQPVLYRGGNEKRLFLQLNDLVERLSREIVGSTVSYIKLSK